MSKIGEQFRKYRKMRGIAQDKLGFEIGISGRQISQIELGNSQPKLSTLRAAATYFNIDISELTGENTARVQLKAAECEPTYPAFDEWLATQAPSDLSSEDADQLRALRFENAPQTWQYSAILGILKSGGCEEASPRSRVRTIRPPRRSHG